MLALARLLRLSLAPSAAADVLVGVLVGHAGHWPGGANPWKLVVASLCVYHGAMALNDWADREADGRQRPDRPLPSGALSPGLALGIGLALPLGGVLLAATVSADLGWGYGALAACAVLYDLVGRGPVRGPLLLGLCRAGNLGLGVLLGIHSAASVEGLDPAEPGWVRIAAPLLYGAFIFSVSALGRMEDGEDSRPLGRRPSRRLAAAALALAAVPVLGLLQTPSPTPAAWAVAGALAWGAAWWLLAARPRDAWTRARVEQAMGRALRTTLPFTAALAFLFLGRSPAALWVGVAVLAGIPVSRALKRALPPT